MRLLLVRLSDSLLVEVSAVLGEAEQQLFIGR